MPDFAQRSYLGQDCLDRLRRGEESARRDVIEFASDRYQWLAHFMLEGHPSARALGDALYESLLPVGSIRRHHAYGNGVGYRGDAHVHNDNVGTVPCGRGAEGKTPAPHRLLRSSGL
jgi:hypothetical protein